METVYQVMPDLTPEEYGELKEDIALRGVMVPVEIDEYGNILDGHHRVKICRELGITDFPTVCREGLTEEEKLTHARKLNLLRRHLSQEQKRELIREQIRETPERPDRQIASDLGVDHVTVGTQRKKLESIGEIHQCPRQTSDGRTYPARRRPAGSSSRPGRDADAGRNPENTAGPVASADIPEAEDEDRAPQHVMTPAEDLLMALKDEAEGEDSVLKVLLCDHEGDPEKKKMLFSGEGIAASLEGLAALREVIEKYEQIVRSRE